MTARRVSRRDLFTKMLLKEISLLGLHYTCSSQNQDYLKQGFLYCSKVKHRRQ